MQTLDGIIKPGHSIIADTLEDVHTRLYHTLIHNHLQQLIRVLGLHYSGVGWNVVRRRLKEVIPDGHELHKLWLSSETETLPGKCFIRMRLQGMYRTASKLTPSLDKMADYLAAFTWSFPEFNSL